mmetsp:Transcript_21748/g.45581  ORF Transcript_21748/g.45581 Transcript_21748/m.45581 type:complete len:209 (-) Transcript_21748:728-1354(-)
MRISSPRTRPLISPSCGRHPVSPQPGASSFAAAPITRRMLSSTISRTPNITEKSTSELRPKNSRWYSIRVRLTYGSRDHPALRTRTTAHPRALTLRLHPLPFPKWPRVQCQTSVFVMGAVTFRVNLVWIRSLLQRTALLRVRLLRWWTQLMDWGMSTKMPHLMASLDSPSRPSPRIRRRIHLSQTCKIKMAWTGPCSHSTSEMSPMVN